MNIIVYAGRMKDDVARLPADVQERLKALIPFLAHNIRHPYLHTKLLKEPWKGYLSFRITRSYRCVFQVVGQQVILLTVDHRKDAYR